MNGNNVHFDINPIAPESYVRTVTQCLAVVDEDADAYPMHHRKRKAIIFNHEIFEHDNLLRRLGTQADVDRLNIVLKSYNFEVFVHNDLELGHFCTTLEEIRKEDFTDVDCIAIFVLTHGKWNKLAAKNFYYTPELLWNTFTAERCPSLGGKPKMFFINACRGEMKDYGVEYVGNLVTDGPNPNPEIKYKLPIHTDILIAFSTVEGYVSHRNEVNGTWFIQTLCEILSDDRCNGMEIKQILTRVSRRVAIRCNLRNSKTSQVPTVVSTLIRDLHFNS
ncbi:Death related ICE-like caspase [Carabus blaptoides fortunei]